MGLAAHLGDIGSAALMVADKRHSAMNAFEKRVWPHRPSDRDASTNVGQVKQPVLKLDARNIIADENSALGQINKRHKISQPVILGGGIERAALPLIKTQTATDLISLVTA